MKIISDGTAQGTKVFVDYLEIKNVTSIVFDPILPGKDVSATIRVTNVALDIEGMEPSPDLDAAARQSWDDIRRAFALPPALVSDEPGPPVDLKKRVRDW